MTLNRELIIPEAIKDLIKNMNREADPIHIRENFRNRLSDIAFYINGSVEMFDAKTGRRMNAGTTRPNN